MITYRYRLLPTRGQHQRLQDALEHSRQLYNAALEERIGAYKKIGKTVTRYDQQKSLTVLREDPAWAVYSPTLQRWPLAQIDLAFRAFFRRLKAGERSGFPRFKGRGWFKTFGFSDVIGWAVDGNRLRMKGIGRIRLHLHRALPGKPVALKVKREGRHWYALLTVEVPCAERRVGEAVGIDLGLSSLAALSTGETIANPRTLRRAQKELRRRQRHLARCKRGSSGRRKAREHVAAAHLAVRRTRDTYLHQISADLTRRFSLIAVEALNVKGLASGMLAREVNDAGWAKLVGFLRYKAERAGGAVVEVDPRHTSQTCPDCGLVEPKTLKQRVHSCPCGCVLDRDVAAARVILHRAVVGPGLAKLPVAVA